MLGMSIGFSILSASWMTSCGYSWNCSWMFPKVGVVFMRMAFVIRLFFWRKGLFIQACGMIC